MSIFETGMLLSFGLAWPVNIYKSVKSKSTKGKSVFFLYIIVIGYVFGIIHKILYSPDIVFVLYILNLSMVACDTVLYYVNKNRERKMGESNVSA